MRTVDTEWLQSRKKELKVNDEKIGAEIGRDRSVANKLISGKLAFDLKYVQGFARALRMTREEVLYRFGAIEEPKQPDMTPTRSASAGDGTVEIIALDLSLSMGPGTLIEEFVEHEPVHMDAGLVRSITRTPAHRLRMVQGIGDSMEPTLRTNDQVLIDINERSLSRISGIYWIDHLGSHGLKRLRPAGPGRILIISDNPNEDNFEVDAQDLRIEGRAIWFARGL
jgi:phage repressor protein C with HTH and peptisase S24 domain